MKERTIQELHDTQIGHKKFAKICDIVIAQGHTITNIKEYNEKFKFQIDGFNFEYSKNWKSSAKDFAKYLLNLLQAEIDLKNKSKDMKERYHENE